MIRGILQFTPSIAFSYVLHRCESRDIRCRESFCVFHLDRRSGTEPGAGARERDRGRDGAPTASSLRIPWRGSRRGSLGAVPVRGRT